MTRFITELHMPNELRTYQILGKGNLEKEEIALRKYGFEKVGSGAFAQVYEKPNYPWVLKVFHNDPGYMGWLRFCMKHQNNKYIPKLRGSFIRVVPYEKIYAVRMEKLFPVTWKEYIGIDHKFDDGLDLFKLGYNLKSVVNKLDMDRDLAEVIQELSMYTSELDLHDENVMKRSDGQIVFSDPLA